MILSGKDALVTGGARGIGLALARRLVSDGARVALVDVDAAALAAAATALGADVLTLAADVTRAADVDGAVARVVERWGRLDILVNNAGITGRSFPIWELSDEDWRRVIEVDLTSVFLCCRPGVTAMLPRGGGRAAPDLPWVHQELRNPAVTLLLHADTLVVDGLDGRHSRGGRAPGLSHRSRIGSRASRRRGA